MQLVSTEKACRPPPCGDTPSAEWGDLNVDITPANTSSTILRTASDGALYERYEDEDETIESRPVMQDRQPIQRRDAIERRDGLSNVLPRCRGSERADQIVHHFGCDLVAEVTGRSRRLVRKNRETLAVFSRIENRPRG